MIARVRRWMKATPALSFSLVLHLLVFVALGAVTFATLQPKEELLITASVVEASDAPVEEMAEIDLGELEEFEAEEFETEVAEMTDVVLDEVSIDAPVAEALPDIAGNAPPVGSEASKSEASEVKSKRPVAKKGKQANASFYGAPAQGNRFLFIVDNSTSMVNGKMLTTLDQLMQTVGKLKAKQEFHVIFYSDAAYPLFYPDPDPGWVKADKANKTKLFRWLQSVELCGGGRLDLALQKAFELQPDSIFLVGDGQDIGKAEEDVVVQQTEKQRFVVHTLCIGGNGKGAEKLAGLAEYTGGTFRFVTPTPQHVEMAKQVKFKMNRKRGKIWGKDVGR